MTGNGDRVAERLLRLLSIGISTTTWALRLWAAFTGLVAFIVGIIALEWQAWTSRILAIAVLVVATGVTVNFVAAARASVRPATAAAVLFGGRLRRSLVLASFAVAGSLGVISAGPVAQWEQTRDLASADAARVGARLYNEDFAQPTTRWETGSSSDAVQSTALRYGTDGYELYASTGNLWVQAPIHFGRPNLRIAAEAAVHGDLQGEEFSEWGVFCRGRAQPPTFFAFVVVTNGLIGIEQWSKDDRRVLTRASLRVTPSSLTAECLGNRDGGLVLRMSAGGATLVHWTVNHGIFPGDIGLLLRTTSSTGVTVRFSHLAVDEMLFRE